MSQSPEQPGVVLLVNPDSGGGEADELADLLQRHRPDLARYSIEDAEAAASLAPERIIVAGGDGSIAPAAALASRTGAPLGVIPVGTANDFARSIGLPLDRVAAAELALEGRRTRTLELGSIDGRPFVNAASTGLSPVAADEARSLKGLLGPVAYFAGALRAGVQASPVRCRVSSEGTAIFDGAAWQVTIGVTGAFGAGSGIDADPSDGLLDVVVIEAGPRLRLLRHAYGLRAGRISEQPGTLRARKRLLEVEVADGPGFNVDGELCSGDRHRFAAEPGAYEVVVG